MGDGMDIIERIYQTAGEKPGAVTPVSGGLSSADKFKVHVHGRDWMVKVLPGTPIRSRWYQELANRCDDRMACPKMHRLFDDGMLCLLSPWITGESLEERLLKGNEADLQRFGRQAAEILLKLHQIPFPYEAYPDQLRKRINAACDQAEQLQLTFPLHKECCAFLRGSMEQYTAPHVCFVHRDVRPENFVICDEQLYLIDFENGSLGERATDFSYLTTMGGERFFPFSRVVLHHYLQQGDDGTFWEKNLLYSTLQLVEYAIWKYKAKGKQVKLQAENLATQYASLERTKPLWFGEE